ncbi:MAG: N-acetylmuramoyl-L-alanine amidase [Sphaerospermopsis sp. SIO1G2]|nr:N-acetylmuramoyl-L-alanine amidase [Sphaerospermopsis sp. SIO1G1]NET72631.1 N-acetylmuramoyl-L-alanine amidase [Sphaerospermopsis sp. SIO1G2]
MRFRDWATRVMLIFWMFATLILVLIFGSSDKVQNNAQISSPQPGTVNQYPQAFLRTDVDKKGQEVNSSPSTDSLNQTPKSISPQPKAKKPKPKTKQTVKYTTTTAFSLYQPQLASATIDSSNYGERHTHDVNGVLLQNKPIIVLHETTNSATSAINFFRNHHTNDNNQASYHTLIALDGTVIYLLSPDKRAYGAGNSIFKGPNGVETVKTNPNLPPSVNNFAYHVSLETPPDAWGKSNIQGHSGYTEAQYDSLAWLIAQSQVPDNRITTHRDVDVANGKVDPLSFDFDKFLNKLHSFRVLKSWNN